MSETYDGEWQLVKQTPFERVWLMAVDENNFVAKRETIAHSLQAEANAVDYNASEGKRWGEGQVMARVPLDIYYRDVLPRKLAGDTAGLKRYWNDPDNRWMRTFKGRV